MFKRFEECCVRGKDSSHVRPNFPKHCSNLGQFLTGSHSRPEKLKKSRPKKLVKPNKSISQIIF